VGKRSHPAIGTKEIQMTGKTHTIKRRLSVIALAASVAAIAIPAAQARNAPVDDWFRDAKVTQAQNILRTSSSTTGSGTAT